MNRSFTPNEIRATVLRLLGEIAPEADLTALKSDINFRDQLDIDSMDFLNFVISIHKGLWRGDSGNGLPEVRHARWLRGSVIRPLCEIALSSIPASELLCPIPMITAYGS